MIREVFFMYGYIKGNVTSIRPSFIIVENQEIGYQIIVPNPYQYQMDEKVKIYTYFHVREDIQALYGFKNEETLEFFKKLLSVSGIGPKSALSITAADDVNDVIMAIENSDIQFLTKFPGIGKKTAQQIILDLKGKLVEIEETLIKDDKKEVKEALIALGYSKTETSKIVKKIAYNESIEVMVKEALSLLLKG